MKMLLSIVTVIALLMVVWLPKDAEARHHKHSSSSYSKTVVRSSGPAVVVPVVPQASVYSSSRISSGVVGAASAGRWVWVPNTAVSGVVSGPRVRTQQYYSSGSCPGGNCPNCRVPAARSRTYNRVESKSTIKSR